MMYSRSTVRIGSCVSLAAISSVLIAHSARAQLGFQPLSSSVAVGSLPPTSPFLLPPRFTQQQITSRFQNGPATPIGGLWDMIAVNLAGPEPGRFLYLAYETGNNAGIGRVDLTTSTITTIVQHISYRRFDGCLWTPWGSVITGEEVTAGRVFEVTNPLDPVGTVSIALRTAVGRVAHEGFKIDAAGNLYFVDEFNGGSIYRFVPSSPLTATALSAGQIFALSDLNPADGANVGAAEWRALNDASGAPLAGIPDPTLDARTAANVVGASDYFRPEDVEIRTLASGNEAIYVATTTSDQVFSVELLAGNQAMVRIFADNSTIDAATGQPVDGFVDAFANPDNLAIDADGIIYIIEDNSPGDVWAALDADNDGVAEHVARWASLSTSGAEPTGLYFDPLRPRTAYVNVQHPFSGEDALFRIVVPAPCPGDADDSGLVDFDDVQSVLGAWLIDYSPATGPGDADRNGIVDFEDVLTVLSNWLIVCP